MNPRVRAVLAACVMILPRTPAAYAGYSLAPLLMIRWRLSPARLLVLVLLLLYGVMAAAVGQARGEMSITAMVLELALMLPFLLFVVGMSADGTVAQVATYLRFTNIAIAAISVLKMPITGIPYLTAPPDYWNGLFGLGGAKLVTVLGFMGLAQELMLRSRGADWSPWIVVVCLANFVIPSYLLGVACGVVALAITQVRSLKVLVPTLLVVLPLTWWVAAERLNAIDSPIQAQLGQHPKIYAFTAAARMAGDTAWIGVGPGQGISTPQTWVDPGLRAVGSQSVPNLPGLFLTEPYQLGIGVHTAISRDDAFAIASSLNQPLTGWATLISEWGIAALVIVVLCARRFWGVPWHSPLWAVAVFVVAMNLLDMWIDSPWFAASLLALFGLKRALDEEHPDKMKTSQHAPPEVSHLR